MKRFLKTAAAAALAAATALGASFSAYAGAPSPIAYNGDSYVWVSGIEHLVIKKDGTLDNISGEYPDLEGDPLGSAKKLSDLKYIASAKDSSQPEIKYYESGEYVIAMWKSDISVFSDAKELAEMYPAELYYECDVFRKAEMRLRIEDGKTYCYDRNGNRQTGWQVVNGSRYYFKKDGEMVTKSTTIGNVRYKFDADGKCTGKYSGLVSNKKTGFKYYYKNGIKQTGWVTRKGDTYYFAAGTGKMIKGDLIIDGYVYHFDENGVWDSSKITYEEYRKERDRKLPKTIGELLDIGTAKEACSIDIWLTEKSGSARQFLTDKEKFLKLLEKDSDVKLTYFRNDDDIDISEAAYTGSDDILIRFLDENDRYRGGWYFSKDKDGSGYIYSLMTFFGAKLGSSAVYDFLKESYMSEAAYAANAKKISALYVSTGWCTVSDGVCYANIENDTSWKGKKFTKGAYICDIRYATDETDLSKIKAGSSNILPLGTKVYYSNEDREVLVAEVSGRLVPFVKLVEG